MGEVYRAHDPTLNRQVAIKCLLPSVTADRPRLARFGREAQALAAVTHPNIASVYGFELSGEAPALVMELVEGPTLADRLAEGALPIAKVLYESLTGRRAFVGRTTDWTVLPAVTPPGVRRAGTSGLCRTAVMPSRMTGSGFL